MLPSGKFDPPPALAKRMSIRPASAFTFAYSRFRSTIFAESACMPVAFPPMPATAASSSA
jgi:hypothetical protein